MTAAAPLARYSARWKGALSERLRYRRELHHVLGRDPLRGKKLAPRCSSAVHPERLDPGKAAPIALPRRRRCAKKDRMPGSDVAHTASAPIYTGSGWELGIERLGLHVAGAKTRTYGRYQVYHSGKAQPGLRGDMCEAKGPGDNTNEGNGRRVEAGRYPVWTQFGRYRSIGYGLDTETPGVGPMPGFRLAETGKRTDILVHPAHPPDLFLTSVGCFNPTHPLGPRDLIDYGDSRARVIALLDDLRVYAPRAFEQEIMTPVADAWVVVGGEPMNFLPASRVVT